MNKTKRVLSVVLAVLMLSSLIAALAIAADDDVCNVVINYVFADSRPAANSWTARISKGESINQTVTSPTVVGYAPNQETVTINQVIDDHVTITVTYQPVEVDFTVKHYQQNVNDDKYILAETEPKKAFTESQVGDKLAKEYNGFTALLYDTTTKVAADGSTVVEIYYDRNYYLMSFNLNGGYGVEPIYAKYGTPISLGEPTKPGYKFDGWTPELPTTMPVGGGTYAAKWTKQDSKYQIQYWQENADDDGYSYVESETVNAATGDIVNYNGNKTYTGFTRNTDKTDKNVTVKGDGSTVLNVYFDREVYTIYFISDTETENVLSCGKEEHTHIYTGTYKKGNIIKTIYYYGGCYPAGSNGSGGATKGNTICGKTEHSHNKRCYLEQDKVVATITAKYGAYIGDEWPTYNGSSTWATSNGGSTYQANIDTMPLGGATFYGPLTSSSSETAYYYVEVIPGEDGTEHGGILYKEHHRDTSAGSGFSITDEDEYPITGFTFKEVKTKSGSGNAYDGATFYYTRNRNNLVFDDQYGTKVYEQLPYEQVLSESVNYKNNHQPAYPSTLEDGAYVFGGWYLDPGCTQPVDWTAKMPDAQVVVYAKWAPKTHTVKTFLTKEKIEEGVFLETYHVPHGTAVTNTPADPPNGSYVFVGWFYEENGVEKAFDFSMPIVKDLNLYAKWSSNTLVAYTIKYELEDGTEVAPPTTGSALAGTTLTFEAKTGDELNEGYQSGYFPETGSHSLTMDINGNNEFTFVYVAKEKVGYTVRYLEKGTEKELHEEKTAETSNAIITEKFVQISGYAPDAYQKRLVLSATEAENVITFWYTKDDDHAPVQIVHWIQNIAGEGYTEYQSSTNLNGEIGQTYTGIPLTIPGFTYNAEKSNASGELTAEGLELNLYYDRVKYSYTVRYVDAADNNKDIDPEANVTGEGLFGAQVIGSQKEFNGYMPADNEPKQKSIIIGTGTNEIIFYYYPCYYIGHVRSGSLNNTDTIRLIGSKANLTEAVTPGYLYGGAFTDVACDADHVQTFTQGENAINFTPVKGETYYIWEVSETYLKPRAYVVSRHDPNAIPDANGSTLNVVGLYLTSSVDRNMYSEVGFTVDGTNFASDGGKVYDKVQAVYTDGSGVKEEMYVMNDGVWDVKAQAPASRGGYVSICTVSMTTFYGKSAESPLSYQPYWVTLDGIKVTSAYEARTCYYQGVGYGDIAISNCVDSNSAVSIYRAATTNTIGVESVAVLSAAPETVQPEVPVTPEIPEVPEAPEMTLNSGAMYLRAQYTYEMMTNTVKFISAIDVNECTEYGFVINGEVVKCEEAAETVDGYDANYLFGGSVNGAMLMSCNMLLDGLVDGMTLNVTPYYVALDGTVVYGETRTLVYRQWVGLEG